MMWRSHDLPLMHGRVQALSLAWTLRHAIDPASPLCELSLEQLTEMDAQFLVSITGTDATLAAPVHAVHADQLADLRLGISLCRRDDGGRGWAHAHRTRAAARSVAGGSLSFAIAW